MFCCLFAWATGDKLSLACFAREQRTMTPSFPAYRLVLCLFSSKWNGQFYFGKCLPMECSSLCKIFKIFSTAIQWMAQYKQGMQHMTQIVDLLFFLVSATVSQCQNKNSWICVMTNVPIAHEKNYWPLHFLNFMGYEIDLILSEVHLLQNKTGQMHRGSKNYTEQAAVSQWPS